jgi:drug/metabolite transporter (DMT)-like permease
LTPASRASLLSTFTVLAVPCLAGLSGQRVKPLVWACGLAALAGTTLLEQGGGEPPNAGDLLSILSALFFAMQVGVAG